MENEPFDQPSEIETLAERARLAKARFSDARAALVMIIAGLVLCGLFMVLWASSVPLGQKGVSAPMHIWITFGVFLCLLIAMVAMMLRTVLLRNNWWAAAAEHFKAEQRARIAAQVAQTQQD